MAPLPPTGRDRLIAMLRAPDARDRLPIRIGGPTLQVGVTCEDGRWRLRRLVLDHDELTEFGRRQLAAGRGFFPDHANMFLMPVGEVLAEAGDLDAFCEALRRLAWDPSW
ncbi:hypothetical protein WME98_29295 [Sorangium sp. So ce296]|uniref:hypothetical protein n=1 Tax=Sorangium sp. So ce296 TaxID=3133296 RepID=UPI003F6293D2